MNQAENVTSNEREYPALTFDEAFEIALKIKTMGSTVTTDELSKALSKKRGGWFALQLASLRRWSLVEGRGEIRLTSLFKRMVAPQRPNDDVEARKEAFLNIPFFKELYEKYGDGLPEEPYFTNALRDTYGLSGRNPSLVARIIREFITKYMGDSVHTASVDLKEQKVPSTEQKSVPATSKSEFPIRIMTPDATFDWDVKHELDWDVVETAINSIKERWKLKQRKSNDSQDTS